MIHLNKTVHQLLELVSLLVFKGGPYGNKIYPIKCLPLITRVLMYEPNWDIWIWPGRTATAPKSRCLSFRSVFRILSITDASTSKNGDLQPQTHKIDSPVHYFCWNSRISYSLIIKKYIKDKLIVILTTQRGLSF
jgi:hypothetical protein